MLLNLRSHQIVSESIEFRRIVFRKLVILLQVYTSINRDYNIDF